jgi:hypothetical protein
MDATRPTGPPGQAPSGSQADRATALAKELGLPTAKVRAALQAVRPAGTPPQGTAPPPGATAPQAPSSSSSTSGTAA